MRKKITQSGPAIGRMGRANPSIAPAAWLALGSILWLLAAVSGAWAQGSTGAWQADVELKKSIDPQGATPPSPRAKGAGANGWGTSTVRPPPPAADGKVEVKLSAQLTQDGEPIDQGLVWRIYAGPIAGGSGQTFVPTLLNMWREATPSVRLAPGNYVVNVAYGRAHLTRTIAVAGPRGQDERFIVNAGGLRVTCHLAGGEKLSENIVSYDIYQGDADQISGRARVVAGLKPGLIVRLNAGLYHLVSTVGDANAVMSADVTVEAGKLTDAVIMHNAARVTFKLVSRAGGEAMADTVWVVHTDQGDLIRESQGALPAHILASGNYIASARHGGRLYQRPFTVTPGKAAQVEVVMQ